MHRRMAAVLIALAFASGGCGSAEARRTGMIAGTAMFVLGSVAAGAGAATASDGDATALPAVGGAVSFAGIVTFMVSAIPPPEHPRSRDGGRLGPGPATPDEPPAATSFAERCDAGDAIGCFELGQSFLTGTGGVRMNPTAACAAFDAACSGGYEPGCQSVARECR